MIHHITIITTFLLLFLIASAAELDNTNKNPENYNELEALTFANMPHSNTVFDLPLSQENKTTNTITKEMIAWEMIRLSWGILAFGLFLVLFIGVIALKKNLGWDRELTRIFTVSIVVTAGLFLITAGYTDQQIAPMFGLLGTMVGYILGKSSPPEVPTKPGS